MRDLLEHARSHQERPRSGSPEVPQGAPRPDAIWGSQLKGSSDHDHATLRAQATIARAHSAEGVLCCIDDHVVADTIMDFRSA